MDLSHAIAGIYRSDDPSAAFRAMVDALSSTAPVRCALYVDAADRKVRDAHPPGSQVSADLLDTVLHVMRPEVFPLGSEFPFDAANFDGAEMLLLPIRRAEERIAVAILIADSGAFGEDLQPWTELIAALETVEERNRRLTQAEERCNDLQRRVEESEALHSLGLAANRTLDKGEVLNLVARFTRTLLGAHYVTANTSEGGRIYTVASVGLRNTEAASEDYHLARTVVEAEKPLVVGGAEANLQVENFPFHTAEGMHDGLGIPLSLFGDTFGALIVGYRTDYEITPRDIRLALTLAGHAAVAISNARLHEAVEERSKELEAAYQELNGLSEAKERFFASINHELRNPLGAILGYLTLVLDGTAGEFPPEARRYLEKANRAAVTLRTLVNDILDLSKIAAGKMDVDLQPCSVSEILDGVLNTIQPLADDKEIPLVVSIPDDLPSIRTDTNRVQQILVNLLSNAVKFTVQGEVRLGVQADPGDGDASDWVRITVSDTGPGISPEDLRLVFEEYEQVKGTKGGTGLGLPISRRLARLLGGDLWAESEVGTGSTFVLRLPAEVALSDGDARSAMARIQ